jgi:hypothetical protein
MMNNIFRVYGEKKTTKPAKELRYRLVNYTQNATGDLPLIKDILDDFLS